MAAPPEPEGSALLGPGATHPSSSSLFDHPFHSKKPMASKRLLSQAAQFKSEEFNVGPVLTGCPTPSRRREEREAMQNLRKRVAPHMLVPPRPPARPPPQPSTSPSFLHSILWRKPLNVVVELSEIRTAWQDSDFITECLCWHNVYRQRHGAPPLTMDPELCGKAQTWANHLAHTNKFSYRSDKDIGQNLYQRPVNPSQNDTTDILGQEVSSYWYGAVRQYDYFKEPDVLHANVNAGHFTQLVWVATRFFGVGKARSRAGKVIVVAHYSPPGNISGGFETNVLPPIPDYNLPYSYDIDNRPYHNPKDPNDSTASIMS